MGRLRALIDYCKHGKVEVSQLQFLFDAVWEYQCTKDDLGFDTTFKEISNEEHYLFKQNSTSRDEDDEDYEYQKHQAIEDSMDYDIDYYANYSDRDLFRDAFDDDIDAWNHWNQ